MRADGGEEEKGKMAWLTGGRCPSPALCRGRVSLPSIFSTGTTDCEESSGALCSDRQGPLPSVSGPGARHDPIARHRKGGVRGPVSSACTFALHMCRVDHCLSEQQEARRCETLKASDGRSVAAALRPSSLCVRVYSISSTSSFLAPLKQLKRPHISPITSTHVC